MRERAPSGLSQRGLDGGLRPRWQTLRAGSATALDSGALPAEADVADCPGASGSADSGRPGSRSEARWSPTAAVGDCSCLRLAIRGTAGVQIPDNRDDGDNNNGGYNADDHIRFHDTKPKNRNGQGLGTHPPTLVHMANSSRMTSLQRREQLIRIGRSLFASKGFEAVSVEEIAARAPRCPNRLSTSTSAARRGCTPWWSIARCGR